tara:strand:+ start:711 stop:923 length:213 start_codon:yes stop_codon:yes gene_type:complete
MMSLYDYQGHVDKDGTGQKVNAYAQLKKQPYKQRQVSTPNYTGKVFLYTREFLDEYFKIQEIFNTELIAE